MDGLTCLWLPTHPQHTPHPPSTRPPPIELIHDIGSEKVSQNPAALL